MRHFTLKWEYLKKSYRNSRTTLNIGFIKFLLGKGKKPPEKRLLKEKSQLKRTSKFQ